MQKYGGHTGIDMIISAEKTRYSPPEHNVIKDVQSDIPLVLVTRIEDYVFNDDLLALEKYAIVDFCEYNWDWDLDKSGTHFFGVNTKEFPHFKGDEWKKFDDWVKTNPPIVYFKRELLEKDQSDKIVSLTYPCNYAPFPIQTKEEFNSRPIELNHYFGRSHEDRVKFQGDAYLHSLSHGITIVDNLYYLQGFLNEGTHKRMWVNAHIPHFARIPIENIFAINGMSKLSLSMPGCGKICFRHAESPVNSVMVMEDNNIAFPAPWVHGYNCIKYSGNPVSAIEEALKRDDLYQIYLNGMATIDLYRVEKYSKNIAKIIERAA